MTSGLWHQGPEVSERRLKLLEEVARKDQGLGKLASELLHVDKNCRMSAFSVKAALTQLRCRVRTPLLHEEHLCYMQNACM